MFFLSRHFFDWCRMLRIPAGIKARLAHFSVEELVHRFKFVVDDLWLEQVVCRLKKSREWEKALAVADTDLYLPRLHIENNHSISGEICPSTLNEKKDLLEKFEQGLQRHFFSRSRNCVSGPDIRTVWEPARLQHISQMLFENTTGSNSDAAGSELLTWIEVNPLLYGPHYLSVMECGLRVPVFFYALKILGTFSQEEKKKILQAIYGHGWWIARRLSLYSSLGNHTICEAVGLVFAGAIFKKDVRAGAWLIRGIELLCQELSHQILEDGGPAEKSINYHRFVLDLYWLVCDFLESNDLYDCSPWKPSLCQGELFLSMFTDGNGQMVAIGDSDDGYAVSPNMIPHREVVEESMQQVKILESSGYTVIREEDGLLFTFDHGGLGLPPLHNHGHADALSITLSAKGEQLLVDPGTFRYNGASEWRSYFKSTRAHSTVNIDGLDQAVQETGFVWSKPFSACLVHSGFNENGVILEAVHDGYTRLKQPVTHKRKIFYSCDADWVLIKDSFEGVGVHSFELNYHLHPEVVLFQKNGWWHVRRGKANIRLSLLDGTKFNRRGGEKSPLLGWFSPEYGIKKECVVLQAKKEGMPEALSFVTAISLNSDVPFDVLKEHSKEL